MALTDTAAREAAGHLSATSDDLPPDLYGYAAMHLAMRRDAQRLTRTLAATPADPESLQRWWHCFRDVIVRHHKREDDLGWPAIAAIDVTFEADIAAMHDDHAGLDAAINALDAALCALVVSRGALGQAREAAATFERALLPHLEREEYVAFHRLAQYPQMWAEVERQIVRGMRVREAAFEVPWVYDGAEPVRLAHLKARLPRSFRPVVRFVWQARYRRMVAAAHATGTVTA